MKHAMVSPAPFPVVISEKEPVRPGGIQLVLPTGKENARATLE